MYQATAALAFFPEPDPLVIEVGKTGVVKVKGLPASADVVLEQVLIADPSVASSDFTGTPLTGKGFVNVTFTGLKGGETLVSFIGTNNGDPVFGTTIVKVIQSPGTSAQTPQVGLAGDPVNTATGEYFGLEAVDLNLGGPMPLSFTRYAASNLAQDALADSPLGANRLHNFASKMLSPDDSFKQVVLPDGRAALFRMTSGKWVLASPLDVPYQLLEAGAEFRFGDPHTKQIWTYDNNGRLTKIEDGKGNTHTLNYIAGKLDTVSDGLGRVIEISQPGSLIESVKGMTGAEEREVTYSYTSGVLTSVTDHGGHITTYGNAAGRPTSVTRPEGNELFTQIYTDGKVTSQTERGTDTSTLDYNGAQTTFTDPTGETLVDTYNAEGRLISHADEAGKAITMTYDSAGRRTSVTDRLGRTTTTLYHAPSGLPAAITNAEGRKTLFAYKARTLSGIVFHDLVKITYPDGASRSFVYDAKGNVTQVKDETGKTWKYTYNTRGQVLTAVNPLGGVTTSEYYANGNLSQVQPPDEDATQFTYDPRFRLLEVIHPGGDKIVYAYDTKDRITSVTDERGKVYAFGHDDNNRTTGLTDPDGEQTAVAFDVLDRVQSITDRLGQTASLTYDSRQLVSSVTDQNGNMVSFAYDERQRLTAFNDAAGQAWTFQYDDEDRLIGISNPVDLPASLRRNLMGFAMEASDPLGNTLRVLRDPMQRVTQAFDPLGRQTTRAYDKMGRLVSVTEQGTGTAKYTRDALGNVTKITDPNGGSWSFAYLKSGRLSKITDPLGRNWSYTYDTRGRPSVLNLPDGTLCNYSYDEAGNLTGQQFSSNNPKLDFDYDDLGRLSSTNGVTLQYDKEGRLTQCPQNGKAFSATYDNGGRLATVSYHDSALTVSYYYDSRNRLTKVADSNDITLDMAYDNAGRLTSLTRTPGIDSTFTYDGAGRLTGIQEGGIINLDYTLNAASEVTEVDFTAPVTPSVTPGSQLLKFGKAGEIVTPGHTYDTRGRLTSSPGRTYGWDGASRLINANGAALTYNGFGDVVTRVESGQTTRFYHHYALGMAPIVYEDTPSGSDRAYVWTPDGHLLYSVDIATGDPIFYHFDRMGSTLALTDKNETVTDSYAYGPFGEPLAHESPGTPSTQPFTYIGKYGVRKEGALYQMRARYYDPQTARFISRDPLPPRLADPKSLNPYEYSGQNPMKFLDPMGEESDSDLGALILMLCGEIDFNAGDGKLLERKSVKTKKGMTKKGKGKTRKPTRRDVLESAQQAIESWKRRAAASPPPAAGASVSGPPGGGHSGAGTFVCEGPLPKGLGGLFPGLGAPSVAVGDFDGSGRPQILVSGNSGAPAQTPDQDAQGGGLWTGTGNITISNNTISSNTSSPNAAQAMVLDFMINVYVSLQAAGSELLKKFQDSGYKSKEIRDKMSAVNKALENVGKVIESLGGTRPPPPM
ncbi:MAG TPA: RHS repeat-associated core domain-containing protein [Prosthecobacter sp.]|nr:RHS repeat-associated core domain-containing protein [Prosthecobacter sp.]HRK15336.1 RHS repeat-associated core domain-containing protein [Prosthecobacter sp.]